VAVVFASTNVVGSVFGTVLTLRIKMTAMLDLFSVEN
jgi:hypothetical protein